MASVRHGGKSRAEAVCRILRQRLLLWKSGNIEELWQRLVKEHKDSNTTALRQDEKQQQREARRVAKLVDQGLLSRAAAQLSSRGIAPATTENISLVEKLFPVGKFPLRVPSTAAPSFEIDATTIKKLIMETPKGLAPGASGLRAEHIKAILGDRNLGVAAQALNLLTKFTNLSASGYFPSPIQAHLCGGRLVPLNKKDSGIRPLVVGETLRAVVAKAALKEVAEASAIAASWRRRQSPNNSSGSPDSKKSLKTTLKPVETCWKPQKTTVN